MASIDGRAKVVKNNPGVTISRLRPWKCMMTTSVLVAVG
jgi:hypothetical protein